MKKFDFVGFGVFLGCSAFLILVLGGVNKLPHRIENKQYYEVPTDTLKVDENKLVNNQ